MKYIAGAQILSFLKNCWIVVCLVVFLFSGFGQYGQYIISFWGQVEAAGKTPKVDLVAILVDDEIYSSIQGDLNWYTNTYIPKRAPWTRSLVIPITTEWFHTSEIQKILSNLYYEGQKDVSSQLVGVMLLGNIPMPVIDLDGQRYVSIYPYVDFDDPMFRYDIISDVFVFNDNPDSLPELWHSVIPSRDISLFAKFFEKLKEYDASPISYAKPMIWYDDFPMMKSSFSDEERARYLNTLIFAEVHKNEQYVPVFSRLMSRDYEEDTVEALQKAEAVIEWFEWLAKVDEAILGDPKAEQAVDGVFQWLDTILDRLDPTELEQNPIEVGEMPAPTKLLEKQMQQEFQPNYTIFWNTYLSEMQDNVLAGWRYQLQDIDTSLEKMEILDRVAKQFVTDMNLVLETSLDSQVKQQEYPLMYPLPYRYSKRKPWYEDEDMCGMLRNEEGDLVQVMYDQWFFYQVFKWLTLAMFDSFSGYFRQGDFMGLIKMGDIMMLRSLVQRFWKEVYEYARYENHYFGKNAVDITSYKDLSIYRWSYFNELSIDQLRELSPTVREEEVDDISRTWTKSSIGASAGWFAQQVEQNISYNLITQALDDKDIYDAMQCDDEQELDDFSLDYRGGGSPMNLDSDKFAEDPKRPITKADTTNVSIAWNPSMDRQVWRPRYDPAGARLVIEEVTKEQLHATAHRDFGSMVTLWEENKIQRLMRASFLPMHKRVGMYNSILDGKIDWCEFRKPLDDYPWGNSFDEVDYFRVYENRFPWWQEWLGITVQPTIGAEEDLDDDRIPNHIDPDRDGDRVPDIVDVNAGNGVRQPTPNPLYGWADFDITSPLALPVVKISAVVANTENVLSRWNGGVMAGDKNPTWISDAVLPTNQQIPAERYDVPHNMKGRNIDGDRTANPNDLDIDGDGISNDLDPDVDGDGIMNREDDDIDNDGIANWLDPDLDGDSFENRRDPDADSDGVPDQWDDDIDSDGIPNEQDTDSDADGEPDSSEEDADGDGQPNGSDSSCGGWGSCNGESSDVDGDGEANGEDDDIDGDGVLNEFDSDVDGDGLLNYEDADIDGDTLPNREDPDMDGDGKLNDIDPDMDGDGELNEFDETPDGFVPPFDTPIALILFEENCVGQIDDVDGDGIPNSQDFDIDGDGRGNREDSDMDGDGILNVEDSDIDCDGKPNGEDDDSDGDGVQNGQDGDIDNDGIPNGQDPDVDGDGLLNGQDGDIDGDGMPNSVDPDIDGDGILNHSDLDMDGDGFPNESDLDVDGDGQPNDMTIDTALNDGTWTPGSWNVDCAANQANQSSEWGWRCAWSKAGWCAGWCGGGAPWGNFIAGWYNEDNIDTDEDGIADSQDPDIDNDGTANEDDTDVDGDGFPNDQDSWSIPDADIDGDGIWNEQDTDIDGDGIPNSEDPDIDGDGIPNEDDTDADADGQSPNGNNNGGTWPDPTPFGPQWILDPVTWLYGDGLRAKREDRWSFCFMDGFDYRYQLIDTVVKHAAPDLDEVDEMTIVTMERPVDDARYMAFHGLGGDVVEFIYPDLWNVPIFDCNLLDPLDIEETIRTYLRKKVEHYNQLLDIQLTKAPAHYAKHPAAYDFLGSVDIAATPNRSYKLIPEDYFIDVLGEKEIKRLSELLYYLSLWRDTRPQAETIGEFIEKARDRFDRNTKQAYVLEEFLKHDKGDDFKFDPIAYPTHIAQWYAYEVGYINSDGHDLIQRQGDIIGTADDEPNPPLPELPTFDVYKNSPWNVNHPWGETQIADSATRDAACGIPQDKAVPLPKWPKAFKCWLEKTIEKPFEFNLKISVDLKGRYDGDEVTEDEEGDNDESWWPFQDQLEDRADQWSSLKFGYQQPRLAPVRVANSSYRAPLVANTNALLSAIGGVASAQQTELIIVNEQNVAQPEEPAASKDLFYDIEVGLSNDGGFFIQDQDPWFLTMRSRTNFWSLRISLTWTWNACPIVEGKNLCDESLQLTSTLYDNALRLPFSLVGERAGKGYVTATICLANNPAECIEKQIDYFLSPWVLDSLSVLLPTDKLVKGWVVPLGLRGFDAFANPLFWVPDDFEIMLSGASFSADVSTPTRTLAGLDEGYMLIYPDSTADLVEVQVTAPENGVDELRRVLWTTSVQVVTGAWSVIDDQWSTIKYMKYRLPQKETGFFEFTDTEGFVFRDNVPSFRMSVIQSWWIDHLKTPIEIIPLKWLLRVGYVTQDENNISRFADENTYITDGEDHLRLRLLPSGKAGTETLEISSPGMETYHITVDILPSGPDNIHMAVDQASLMVGGETPMEITVTDSWGNLYEEEVEIDLQLWWGIEIVNTGDVQLWTWETQSTTISCQWGKATVMTRWTWGWSCGWWASCSNRVSFPSPWSTTTSDTDPTGGWWDDWDWSDWSGWDGSDWGDGGNQDGWTDADDSEDEWPDWDWSDEGDEWDEGDGDGDGEEAEDSEDESPDWDDGEDDEDDEEWGWWEEEEEEETPEICEDVPPAESTTWLPAAWYEREDATFGEFQAQVPDTLWPNKPDEDINVMYLNVYGYPWGNSADTVQYLKNSKTLAVTTFRQIGAMSTPWEVLTAMVHPDGKVQDILWNMISELVVAWGTVFLKLGHQGGVGTVTYGTHPEFDMLQSGEEFGDRPHKMVYTPAATDSLSQGSIFTWGKIFYNDKLIVDVLRGYMDPHVHIRWSGAGNDRRVTYENKQIGSLRVYRDATIPLQKTILHPNYRYDDVPFWWSSADDMAIGVYLQSSLAEWSSSALFESIEASFDPRKNIWFRHNFKPITNFSQGMRMWPATQQFGWPFLINYGDPFLERVKDSRLVKHTDYDAGPWKAIFSDSKSILDVDTGDLNKDGKTDLIISYKDGSVRILKNYGGGQPYKDLWHIIVVADGLKETFIGDVDGDGRDDIMVSTQSDKLRVYMNNKGQIAVDGTIVCLDIPNGDVNVAQVRQLFVEDMDGDDNLDIITNDINGDIKVFFWGWGAQWWNYLSTDPFQCDAGRLGRQKQQLVKSFSTTLWWPIRDSSLRHWPELVILEDNTSDDPPDEEFASTESEPNVKKMKKKELKEYAANKVDEVIGQAEQYADPETLLARWISELDARFEVPDILRPLSHRGEAWFAAVAANDTVFPGSPRFDVEKQFTDLNGEVLEKGDLVRVDVSLIPVGTVWPVIYRERLDGPWVLYKDEFNKIDSFDRGSLPAAAQIDRNIGQWYQFMVYDLPLWSTATFSYEVQYDGNGYVNIQIETLQKEWFKGPTNQSVASNLFWEAHAAGREKRIRAYPDDACWKEYRLFSPEEEKIQLAWFLEEKQEKYAEHFEESRQDLEDKVKDPTNLDPLAEEMGISPNLKNKAIENRRDQLIFQALGVLWWGDINFELDADTYLNYFVEEAEQKVEDVFKESAKWAMEFATLGLFPDDYEFSYNKCEWFKFGNKMCGAGWPIPFNNDLLSPGAFHIFWCKPKVPIIPRIFPEFAWLPLIAIPTSGVWPMRPINPVGAGAIFGGKTSQFRTYLTWTTANGMWLSLCFWPYDMVKLPTPLGDLAGNCIVIAGNIWSQCTAADDSAPPENMTPRTRSTNRDTEARTTLFPKQLDAYAIGSCDEKVSASSPFRSPTNGGRGTNVRGNVAENQSTKADLRPNTRDGNRLDGYTAGAEWVTIEDVFGWHGGDTFEVDYLKGGVGFKLQIEEGKIWGLISCIFRKRKEKQIAYFTNNALNMNITIVLPTLEQIGASREQARHISDVDTFQQSLGKRSAVYKDTQNSGKEGNFEPPETKKITRVLPKAITQATSDVLNNPFDKILQFFDQVPLINVEVRDVPLEIPLIYDEDFTRYAFHLESWVMRNGPIIEEWKKVDRIDSNAVDRMQQSMTNVQRNLAILYEYKSLPGKVYALLHASDQYIISIFQFIDTFISKLTWWLQDNAMRFSHWVDFIITLKGIIKTRQLVIDFTVNWQDRCSKCRQDHYDYYSCKLKLLCVDLPVIPIPSFHLPDIFIDLSNIQVGLDLIIPRFRFVPRRMDLFQIPDLPLPRWIEVDLVIPTIPLLPPPPVLPELPELELDLDMVLPVLPPAPKMPALSPAIKAVVKIMDIIGKFFCIFKWWIGLVREKFIKARVEQMTQRKQNIMPFDWIKIKMPTSPLQAYDYRVDATVDLKFDFRQLFDLAQDVADDWNGMVNKGAQTVKSETLEYFKPFLEGVDKVQDIPTIDTEIDIDLRDSGAVLDEHLIAEWGEQRPRILVWGAVDSVRAFLLDNVKYILSRQDLSRLHPKAISLVQDLQTDPQVRPNIAGVINAGNEAQRALEPYEQEIATTKELIKNDWDGFLDSLATRRLLSAEQPTQRFVSSLFEADPVFIDQLRAEPHPMKSYFDMNEIFVDWFSNALSLHSPDELQMHQVQYDELARFLWETKENLVVARQAIPSLTPTEEFGRQEVSLPVLFDNIEQNIEQDVLPEPSPFHDLVVQQAPNKPMDLAQVGENSSAGTPAQSSLSVDFTQFIDWFFIPGKDGNYHDIVARKEKANTRYEKNTYQVADVNGDGQLDIINFDEHQIYVKYGKQMDNYPGVAGYEWVTIGPFTSYQQLVDSVIETKGWYGVDWFEFKLRDEEDVAYEFSRQGHNYSSMSFIWDNDPRMNGYVIMVTDEQQTSEDKMWRGHGANDPARTRYVIVLPQPIPEEGLHIEIPDLIAKQSIESLKRSWKVIDVIYYDGQAITVEAMLQHLDRKWYYTKHAPLRMERQAVRWIAGFFNRNLEERVLKKVWPRSRQQVAGAQARGDTQLPWVDLELERDITGEIKARWPLMQGNINTTYTLRAKRRDNGQVIKNRLIRSGEVVQIEDGDALEVKNIDYNYPVEEQLLFVGMDQAGNVGQQEVRLNIVVPDLKINEIRYLGVGAEVETELSDTIDRGQIKFEKNRFGLWKPLMPDTFSVKPTDPIVVGGLYPFDTKISIKDDTGQQVAVLDTQTWEITLEGDNGTTAWWATAWSTATAGWPTAWGSTATAWWATAGGASAWWWASAGDSNAWGGASAGNTGAWGWSWGQCSTRVRCGINGKPVVEIVQAQTSGSGEIQKVLMNISYTPKELLSGWITLLDTVNYQLRELDTWYVGKYRNGWCVSPLDQECHIFISQKADVLIPSPRNELYQGDVFYEDGTIVFVFKDSFWRPVVRIAFISETFQ
jgi:hypothetical protein